MVSSNIQLRVDNKMKYFIQLARKCILDSLEEEIEKTENEELREALSLKLTEVLENDLIINKSRPRHNFNVQYQRIPTDPVYVRGTSLKLKNVNNTAYKKFCNTIADIMGYTPDFSDSPFNNIPKNARVYEALKKLYSSGRMDQEYLDQLIQDAESSE
jgi:hypothetical protein